MYTDENYVSRCRERMPALLYNRVSRELVLRFVSCRFVSLTNHTSVGVVRDATREGNSQRYLPHKLQLSEKTRSPRNPLLTRTGSSSASCRSVV